MLCHQCGSPVSATDSTCPNCQADLKRGVGRAKLRSDGLKRMTRQMRAIQVEDRYFPPNEEVSERFILGELIGRGPFGEVYRAQDSLIDAQVALKVFTPELIAKPQDQERFLKVSRTARTLTQPNVVRVHCSGVHKDHAWVSMQALDGLSLRKVMKMRRQKREHFPLDEIEPILNQIIRAAGHVHREFPIGNLKPDNIILMPELIKLTDHYLLAAFDTEQVIPRLAESRYLAPELRALKDKSVEVGEIDPRCDIFSLGLMIGEMVFGPDYTPGATEAATSPLDALCRRACAQDPAERYDSFEALSEDFSTLIDTGALLGGVPYHLQAGDNEATKVVVRPVAPDDAEGEAIPVAAPELEADEAMLESGDALSDLSESSDDAAAIAENIADDMATREYVRDSKDDDLELGDLLATNEVPRDVVREKKKSKKKGGKKKPAAAAASKKSSAQAKDIPKLPSIPSVAEVEPTTTSVKPAPPSAAPAKQRSSLSPGVILAGILALFLIVGVGFWAMRDAPAEKVELGDSATASAEDSAKGGEKEEAAEPATGAEAVAADPDAQAMSEKVSVAQKEAEQAVFAASQKALESAGALAAAAQAEAGEKASQEAAAVAAAAAEAEASEQTDGARAAEQKVAEKPAAEKKTATAKGAAVSPAAAKGAAKPADKPAEKVAAAGTKCKAGMLLIKRKSGNYCIDAYEYPGRGSKPKTNASWFQAQQLCEARGARLCKQQEWRSACGSKYPYGSKWNPDSCNTVDEDEFERSLAAAGSFKQCRSRSGAYDMVGNAHEWVAEQRIAGGGFDSGSDVAQCGYSSAKAPGSGSSNIGFRCCGDAE